MIAGGGGATAGEVARRLVLGSLMSVEKSRLERPPADALGIAEPHECAETLVELALRGRTVGHGPRGSVSRWGRCEWDLGHWVARRASSIAPSRPASSPRPGATM